MALKHSTYGYRLDGARLAEYLDEMSFAQTHPDVPQITQALVALSQWLDRHYRVGFHVMDLDRVRRETSFLNPRTLREVTPNIHLVLTLAPDAAFHGDRQLGSPTCCIRLRGVVPGRCRHFQNSTFGVELFFGRHEAGLRWSTSTVVEVGPVLKAHDVVPPNVLVMDEWRRLTKTRPWLAALCDQFNDSTEYATWTGDVQAKAEALLSTAFPESDP